MNFTNDTYLFEENETLSAEESIAKEVASFKANMDQMFLFVMGSIVLFMQAGFALIEVGTVRAKNATSILIKNISDMCFGAMAFWLCGFAFAFGEGNPFIGLDHFLAITLPKEEYSFLFFQGTFAATCATIVSGAIAERSDYNGYVIFSVLITGVVYPIQTHWCWGPSGWLTDNGFYDFAGSGVVHLAGGVCALVATYIIKPRIGKFKDDEECNLANHSIPLMAIGFFVLVFGFLAFNGGSLVSITNAGDGAKISMIFYGTVIACCAGGIAAIAVDRFRTGYWKITIIVNGGLAGMVSVCCGCDGFYPWSSALAGSIGGVIYYVLSHVMKRLKLDDPIDAVAVHGGAGAWGLIAGPLFRFDGVLSSNAEGASKMLLWNLIGLAAIVAWNAILSFIIFGTLGKMGRLRVSEECEVVGLDLYKHDVVSYPEFTNLVEYFPKSRPANNSSIYPMEFETKNPGVTTIKRVVIKEAHTNNRSNEQERY